MFEGLYPLFGVRESSLPAVHGLVVVALLITVNFRFLSIEFRINWNKVLHRLTIQMTLKA